MAKKTGLGRGLDALFQDQVPVVNEDEEKQESVIEDRDCRTIEYLDINNIKPNENQPRKNFDEDKIGDLAQSIKEHGIIQPLVVRESSHGFEIVAGERRWRAARKAGFKEVPCIIREFSDEENMIIAIIENMQREDLDPIEEAEGLNQMIKTYGFTQAEVSKSVGKSRPYITNSMRLLKLPEEIQKLVSTGKIRPGHARAVINIEDKKIQAEICRRIIEEDLSVREVERLASCQKEKPAKKKKKKKEKSPEIILVENDLKGIYGTKVNINQKGKKGKIEIEYYNIEELNRILELLRS